MFEVKEQGRLTAERIYEGRHYLMVIHYMPGTWHVIHSSNKLNLSVQESGGTPTGVTHCHRTWAPPLSLGPKVLWQLPVLGTVKGVLLYSAGSCQPFLSAQCFQNIFHTTSH